MVFKPFNFAFWFLSEGFYFTKIFKAYFLINHILRLQVNGFADLPAREVKLIYILFFNAKANYIFHLKLKINLRFLEGLKQNFDLR